MVIVYFLLFFALLLCYCDASGQFSQYSQEHQVCSIYFVNDTIVDRVCQDMEYVQFFKSILSKSDSSDFSKSVASAVLDLYIDLEKFRAPYLCPLEFHHPYLSETNHSTNLMIYPISFAIPEDNIVSSIPPKVKAFGKVIPGHYDTYFSLTNESHYFEDMQQSLFVLTHKKAGWDCLRHYEILAAGALPLFLDIESCPSVTLTSHPKNLYKLLLQYPGLRLDFERENRMKMKFKSMDFDVEKLDNTFYLALTQAMLQYTRNVHSTKSLAKYVLTTMYNNSYGHIKHPLPQSVFYLSHQDDDMNKGDYMTDFLLHGLIELLGHENVVDLPPRDGIYKNTKNFNLTNYLSSRSRLYGSGFSWGMKLDRLTVSNARDYQSIRQNILSHKYDLVILGSGHRDGWASRLFLWDEICKSYHPFEVAIVEGSDEHIKRRVLQKYSPCAAHLFTREGYFVGNDN